MALVAPKEHYRIVDQGECSCHFCSPVPALRDKVDRARMLFDARRCRCRNCSVNPKNPIWKCIGYQRAHYAFLSASVKRDLYIEMSYHAVFGDEQDGDELMAWIDRKIRTHPKRDGWWATHAERLALDWWFCAFDDYTRAEAKRVIALKIPA